jgi:NitT/TauT family transport system substrate-binding protein
MKNSASRFSRRTIAGFALALLLLGGERAVAETIKIGALKSTTIGPIYVAQAKGYFAAEGLTPEFVYFDASPPIATAVVSGNVDIGATGLTAALYNLAGQNALRIVAAGGREMPTFHGNAILASNAAYLAGLRMAKDLPGHSVALGFAGGVVHYALALVSEKYGFDLKAVRLLFLQTLPNQISAVAGAQADATLVPATIANPAIARGDAKLVSWIGDEVPWQVSAVFVATKTATQRKEMIERFLRAYRYGARDYHDAFTAADGARTEGPTAPEILAILTRAVDQPEQQVKASLPYIDGEARLDVADVLHQVAWYQAQGMIKTQVQADELIDPHYVVALPKD